MNYDRWNPFNVDDPCELCHKMECEECPYQDEDFKRERAAERIDFESFRV